MKLEQRNRGYCCVQDLVILTISWALNKRKRMTGGIFVNSSCSRLLMAMAKAGKAGRIYHSSFVWIKVNSRSTIDIHAKTKVSAFERLNAALNKQNPAEKGSSITQNGFSLLTK